MSVVNEIAAERTRQVEVEGWSHKHDDAHTKGEMADAAACYLIHRPFSNHTRISTTRVFWPWAAEWWKPKDRRQDLVRAGALIVAEIERLDRKAAARRSAQEQPK